MKLILFALILVLGSGGFVAGQSSQFVGNSSAPRGGSSGPIDLVLLLDTSSSMNDIRQEIRDYITGSFLRQYLRMGDTFHFITFSERARIEIVRRIEGQRDVETILGRIFLMYPLDPYSDIPDALGFAERYVASIPGTGYKKIVLISNGNSNLAPGSSSPALNAAGIQSLIANINTRLNRVGIGLDFVKIPARTPPATALQPDPQPTPGPTPQTTTPSIQTPPQRTSQVVVPPAQTPPQTTPQVVVPPVQTPPAVLPGTPTPAPSTQATGPILPAPSQTTPQVAVPPVQTPPPVSQGAPPPVPSAQVTRPIIPVQPQTTPQVAVPPTQTPPPVSQVVPTPGPSTQAARPILPAPSQTTPQAAVPPVQTPPVSQSAPSVAPPLPVRPSPAEALPPLETAPALSEPADKGTGIVPSERLLPIPGIVEEVPVIPPVEMVPPPPVVRKQPPRETPVRVSGESFLSLLIGLGNLVVLVVALVIFLLLKRIEEIHNRTFVDKLTAQDEGPPLVSLFVEDQNTAIGSRNMHILKPGYSLTLGGGTSDFLIFLVPLPPNIAIIRFDGKECMFIPKKPQFFPDTGSQPTLDCIGKTIRVISGKDYEFHIRLEQYEDPLRVLKRFINSVHTPR